MKVSVNTIKQYIDVDLPPTEELVARINAQLGQVEEVIDLAAKYKDATIVKVVECEKHPNADKLSICKIDDGSGELVQVVCGAPNVHADMLAVWLPPESIVPSTFGASDEFRLGARELRGVMSHGMLASARELAIGDEHDGIISIAESDLPANAVLAPGASFADTFGLNDTIIDIENKMFTHRPDLFGQLGVAREISAILQGPTGKDEGFVDTRYENPDWYWTRQEFDQSKGDLDLDVFNESPQNAPRFMAVAMNNVTVGPSPMWLQCALVALGSKPINSVVDITNYIMPLTAQPTHAYDYDKLDGHKVGARMARPGEKVTLLNGKTYQLDESDIVIADGSGVVGLAGVMGGLDSEVTSQTKNIVLEVATFDMYTIRRTSMRYGLFTDAVTRFSKGQSNLQNSRVLSHLVSLVHEVIGADQASPVYDMVDSDEVKVQDGVHDQIEIKTEFINARLGLDLSTDQIGNLLRRVNFASYPSENDESRVVYAAPFWRTDIELPEDIVEEVGRLYGYDKLPRQLPMRSTSPTATNDFRELAQKVRNSLARAGANEVLTYSFVHERVLAAAGQDPSDAYRITNALSPDLQYYRLSLTPSLLDKMHANIKAGYDEFALFEIGKSHSKKAGVDDDGLPVEPGRIALAYGAKTAKAGAAYYQAKSLLEYLAAQLGLVLEYKPLPEGSRLTAAAPFVAPRSARVLDTVSGQAIGLIGEYSPMVKKQFKLPDYSAGFELFTEGLLLTQRSQESQYQPLSRYPSIERDICFEGASDIAYGDLTAAMNEQLSQGELQYNIGPVDIYGVDAAKKRVTLRIRLTSRDSTLTSEAANAVIDSAAREVAARVGATII